MIDIQFAPEIRGVQCPECGGSLVRHSNRAYCDWCQLYVRPKKEYTGLEYVKRVHND